MDSFTHLNFKVVPMEIELQQKFEEIFEGSLVCHGPNTENLVGPVNITLKLSFMFIHLSYTNSAYILRKSFTAINDKLIM